MAMRFRHSRRAASAHGLRPATAGRNSVINLNLLQQRGHARPLGPAPA